MRFNPSKCNTVHMLPGKKLEVQSSYSLHGQSLEAVPSAKYLGVTISNDLTRGKHIETVTAKGNRTLGFLRRNMRDCSHEVRCATYTALVRPTLEYASTVWDPHKKQDMDLLETVQRKAARYACNCYLERTPGTVTALLERLRWESL